MEVFLLERASLKSLDSLNSKGPLDPSQPTKKVLQGHKNDEDAQGADISGLKADKDPNGIYLRPTVGTK